jgi:hypothetical protein
MPCYLPDGDDAPRAFGRGADDDRFGCPRGGGAYGSWSLGDTLSKIAIGALGGAGGHMLYRGEG